MLIKIFKKLGQVSKAPLSQEATSIGSWIPGMQMTQMTLAAEFTGWNSSAVQCHTTHVSTHFHS